MRFVLLAFLLGSSVSLAAETDSLRRFALIVGTNDGGHGRSQLRYAESDASNVLSVLESIGGVSPSDARLVLSPKRSKLVSEIEAMKKVLAGVKGSRRVEFVFYYSGHSDEEGLLLGEERYGYRELRTQLDSLPVDVRIAILDSCASGAMTRRKGGAWKAPFMVDDSSQVRGHAFLTSAADDEAAQESDRLRASFFTHYLVSGLRGAADATGDGRVTLNEAYHYAFNETLSRTQTTHHGPQHPAYDIQLSGTGDLVLTEVSGSNAGLRISTEIEGRLFVRDAAGKLVAELVKQPGRVAELGLERGDYVVTLQSGGQMYGGRVRLVDGRRTELSRLQLAMVSTEANRTRGGTHHELPAVDSLPLNAPGEEIEEVYEEVDFYLGLVPGIGVPGKGRSLHTRASVGLVPGVGRVHGFTFGLGGSLVYDSMRGGSMSPGFNLVRGPMRGGMTAGGFNITTGDTQGLMVAGGFNVLGTSATHSTHVAIAGGFNIAGGELQGAQVAGGFNITDERMSGVQIAGGFNRAGSLRGAQISLVNVGGEVKGLQLGLLNVADTVKGVQLGLLNISREMEGVPIGLLSVVKTGMFHPQLSMGTLTPPSLGLKIGSKRFYTRLDFGVPLVTWYASAGLGVRFPLGPLHLDFDIGAGVIDGRVLSDTQMSKVVVLLTLPDELAVQNSARLSLGWQPFEHFGVFAGAGVFHIRPLPGFADFTPTFRPDFFAGVSF